VNPESGNKTGSNQLKKKNRISVKAYETPNASFLEDDRKIKCFDKIELNDMKRSQVK
jgi:hypothetical protein